MAAIKTAFDIIEEIAPSELAEEWDNIGLQIGAPGDELKGVMVALDATPEVVGSAAERGFNLLVTHHPLFFSGVKSIDTNAGMGKTVKAAILGGVTIFSAHTNLDSARGGINDMLAEMIGLKNTEPLMPADSDKTAGLGRVGELEKTMRLDEVAQKLRERLNTPSLRMAGNMEDKIKRVALCSGSGGSMIDEAARHRADLFITGDIKYHDARQAEETGMSLIDAGHFATERIVVEQLSHLLKKRLSEKGIDIPVEGFQGEREPFTVI